MKYNLAKLTEYCHRFKKPSDSRALRIFCLTISLYLVAWVGTYYSLVLGKKFLFIPFAVATAMMLLRTFVIQHDVGHYSFFKKRSYNTYAGRVCSVLTLTPFNFWLKDHAQHHATNGKLDARGTGDIWLLTVNEFKEQTKLVQVIYRIYRHPIFLILIAPQVLFFIFNRFPRGLAKTDKKARNSILVTNVFIILLNGLLMLLLGWKEVLIVQLVTIGLTASFGVFLFYLQHNFESSYFEKDADWDFAESSLDGSSVLNFGRFFDFISLNSAYHNVHHFSAQIPAYELKNAHDNLIKEGIISSTKVSFLQGLKCLTYRLWDEEKKVMVSF